MDLLLLIGPVCVARICWTRYLRATMEAQQARWPAGKPDEIEPDL